MRKQTKLAVGMSAAALLVIGASFASMATTRGWVNEGDEWYYYDNSGDIVTDKWKSYNGNYFYLGDDGAMVTSSLIEDDDDYYYVDANGAMVKNTWVAIAADDDEEEDVDYRWYYFQSTGKAVTENKGKSINGKKYSFDDEGKMLFGFVDGDLNMLNTEDDPVLECVYYYGTNDDGARHTGWLRYDDSFDDDDYDDLDYEYYWFNFKSNGQKRYADNAAGLTDKKIGGSWYVFDSNGVMRTEWQATGDATVEESDGTVSTKYSYYSGTVADGSRKKSAWFYTDLDDDRQDEYDEDGEFWFRTDSKGDVYAMETKKVNGKWYAFNDFGGMMTGLVVLDKANVNGSTPIGKSGADYVEDIDTDEVDGDDLIYNADIINNDYYLYYFSDSDDDGSMKTGTSVKISLADDDYTFYFVKTKGYGYTGIKSNKLYSNGVRIEADSDDKYEPVVGRDNSGVWHRYLVNSTGTIQSIGSYYKDGNDNYYVTINTDSKADKEDGYDIYMFADDEPAKLLKKAGSIDDVDTDDEDWESPSDVWYDDDAYEDAVVLMNEAAAFDDLF